MTDEPKDSNTTNPESDAKVTKKKTTKKTSKKVTKKTAKKKAAKKTTKKVAKKKTTKKAAKKKTTKKVAASSDVDADAEVGSDEGAAEEVTAEKTTKKKAAKKTTKKKASKKKTTKKVAKKTEDEADDSDEASVEDEKVSVEIRAEDDDSSDEQSDQKKTAKKSSKRSSKKASSKSDRGSDRGSDRKPERKTAKKSNEKRPRTEMIVNYVPGEDCRIAVLEDGQLEDVFYENTNQVSRVNNIYVGRVSNVEPSIQAAFVDFGGEENGFLHISDIHPQYFAKGDDKTERVGKKTPHRDRPPIQECLKKGQEIIVQVLKEGVGTKGPSLTSYLSIPGRFLVMMPGMDKVGVSRKEEDDDKRKAAKTILGSLDLPEGFGFILRTAGFDRNKTELKRDLAYLNRLWADMEKRRKGGKKPRLLYSESDLLVRTVRDLLSSEIDRVVIDSEAALKRVGRFVKIAAPRSHAKLAQYVGTAPIFHAYDIERQIEEIHAREVELPSGGRLVIDQTEALVAIDVNSGKSRSAKDAETNAYKTNVEAVDAICRQLRLRDLGGLVVNDMIDMRHVSHRKDIENRFRERLKKDRAKTTIATISPFGLLEMTRQRMRGSMESQHFADCPLCRGRGLVQRPGSVADTALRDLAALIDDQKVHRAELVVHPRVASELLSTRRSSLIRVELNASKTVDVRVSDALAMDRFAIYAYEANGNDLDTEKLRKKSRPKPKVVDWVDTDDGSGWAVDLNEESDESTVLKLAENMAKKADQVANAELPIDDSTPLDTESGEESSDQPKKKRRRRRKRGRSDSDESNSTSQNESSEDSKGSESASESSSDDGNEGGDAPKKKRRRRRGRGRSRSEDGGTESGGSESGSESKSSEPKAEPITEAKPVPKPRRRGLYSGGRRKLSSSEVASIDRNK